MSRVAVALLALAACRADRREAPRRDMLDLDVALAAAKPAPLVGFSCRKQITGKRPNGELRVTFSATSPRDATWEVAWNSGCTYHGALHLVNGRLDDGFLGRAYEYRCTRSPYSRFAVSCGTYLGSDLEVIARGDDVVRRVHVRLPWTFHAASYDCEAPVDELVFAQSECAVTD